ncbi:unnamed protein product [Protopolystoma xenopodis]|uniref:Uncharacterized protein n=1 Tax=Protopolystoma xenopodis TaxID=117903 RepID=A0A448XRI3_9PLAT|nr:unnamed protein product [Protopolystoma xenopodis]
MQSCRSPASAQAVSSLSEMPRSLILPVTAAALAIGASAIYLGHKYYFSGGKCYIQGRLDGKIAIVTGANSGIGLETCGELARRGATVIMAARSMARLEEAKAELLRRYSTGERALSMNLASSSLKSSITHVRSDQASLPPLKLLS